MVELIVRMFQYLMVPYRESKIGGTMIRHYYYEGKVVELILD